MNLGTLGPWPLFHFTSGTRCRIEEEAEREKSSCVVSHAKPDPTGAFWLRVDKQRQAAPRLRLVRER